MVSARQPPPFHAHSAVGQLGSTDRTSVEATVNFRVGDNTSRMRYSLLTVGVFTFGGDSDNGRCRTVLGGISAKQKQRENQRYTPKQTSLFQNHGTEFDPLHATQMSSVWSESLFDLKSYRHQNTQSNIEKHPDSG
jgi:hypothetical protein